MGDERKPATTGSFPGGSDTERTEPPESVPLLPKSDGSSSDNDGSVGGKEPAAKRLRMSSLPSSSSALNLDCENLNTKRSSACPGSSSSCNFKLSPGDYVYFSSSDTDSEKKLLDAVERAEMTGFNFPLLSSPSTSDSDCDYLPAPTNPGTRATLTASTLIPPETTTTTVTSSSEPSKNPVSSRRPLRPVGFRTGGNSSSSSSDSFSCVLENVRKNNRDRKVVKVYNHNDDDPFDVPLDMDAALRRRLDNISSSSGSSFPSPRTGDELVLPADWEDDTDSESKDWPEELNPVVPQNVDDDRVYDLEFEPASVSESEIHQNPIEDASSSSGLDERVDVHLPSVPDSETRGYLCKDDDTFADEESDITDKSDPHGLSSDSEISEKDKWPCHQCKTLTHALSRYCLRCFRTRRNWLPNRPKPRSRAKDPSQGRNDEKFLHYGSKHDPYSSDSSSVGGDEQTDSEIDDGSSKCKLSPSSKRPRSSSPPSRVVQIDHSDNNGSLQNVPKVIVNTSNNNIKEPQPQLSQQSTSSNSSAKSMSTPKNCVTTVLGAPSQDGGPRSSEEATPASTSSSERSSQASNSQSSDTSMSLSQSQSQQPDLARSPLEMEEGKSKPRRNSTGNQQLCSMCCIRDKDAAFVHNKIAHRCCCFPCADKILKRTGKCPICREKILRVVKIINDY